MKVPDEWLAVGICQAVFPKMFNCFELNWYRYFGQVKKLKFYAVLSNAISLGIGSLAAWQAGER